MADEPWEVEHVESLLASGWLSSVTLIGSSCRVFDI